MEDYIAKTVSAYDDVETFEKRTNTMILAPELDEFLGMLDPSANVLDAGCAYGRDANYIRTKGFQVQGMDLSAALIRRAHELYPDVAFKVADVRATGFADSSFDGIWCNATLLHLNDEDMLLALKEFNRILRPGGVLTASLKKGEGTQQFVEKFSSNSERFFNFKTHETFLELLSSAGLKETSWHYVNERERFGQDKRDLDWLYSYSKKV